MDKSNMLSKRQNNRTVVVRCLSAHSTKGIASYGNLKFACAIGRSGIKARKREGDGASPAGRWPIRTIHYRPDRVRRFSARPSPRPIRRTDAWCDIAGDRNYNRQVRLPYPSIDEQLWRSDNLYDILAVLGYNDRPRIQFHGSAIFMHIARPGLTPTAGCVAMNVADLRRLLEANPPPRAVQFVR